MDGSSVITRDEEVGITVMKSNGIGFRQTASNTSQRNYETNVEIWFKLSTRNQTNRPGLRLASDFSGSCYSAATADGR